VTSTKGIRIGTSAFTADGWEGSFYPDGMKAQDFLSFYATKFDVVELDTTFYRAPSPATVQGWNAKTPAGFLFTAKVPKVITHEKVLVDCADDLNNFVKTMDALGEKLGPMLFQFGYFNKAAFPGLSDFLKRLDPFLKILPKDHKFALEIRNKNWLVPKFIDLLREYNVALALIDQAWMPRPADWFAKFDPITADFTYIRWLGDRKGIEALTKVWDKTIVDRNGEMREWVKFLSGVQKRKIQILAFANNHYAGNGPATVELFKTLWDKKTTGG
jgi:uncharacterized protein YecE (DUF72 family)